MERILVIGCPGAGKSTFSRRLRDILQLPLFYLDMLWHKPDKTNVSREEFDARLAEILSGERWIVDGNYQRTLPWRLARCTTVFFLDYPVEVCLEGAAQRVGQVREDMPWVETELDPEFQRCIETFSQVKRPEILALLEEYREGREIVVFHSREESERYLAVQAMIRAVTEVLAENKPTVYLYGSCVLDDFRLGWSDIDILVLTREQITEEQALRLVTLRQEMLAGEPENLYYRSFEGGMLTLSAFQDGTRDRVVYWGTTGQRVTERYVFDSFSRTLLLEKGRILYGEDVRAQMKRPSPEELKSDAAKQYDAIRRYARQTDRSLYSFGWLLDIARCLYTLRTGKISSKTAAGRWALADGLCPVPDALELALAVRESPLKYRNDGKIMDLAEGLGPSVQRFADELEKALTDCHAATGIRPPDA